MAYIGKEAYTCARLSQIVYELPYQIRPKIKEFMKSAEIYFRTFPHRNSRVLVVVDKTVIYVIFRGTVFTSWRSWLANLTTNRRSWMKGKVHSGFLGILEDSRSFFQSILSTPSNLRKEIYFSGHSQGGAVAFLATIDNKRFNPTSLPAKSYTFGQPRTGNKQFCRIAEIRLGRRHNRIVNRGDIVVGVPFVWQGFDHVRDFLQYDDHKIVIRRYQNEGAGWPHANIPDHFMKYYLASAKTNEAINL